MPDKDDPLIIHPDALREMEKIAADDPKAAEAFRELCANLRQAMTAWKEGKYPTFDEAMFAISGKRPIPVPDHEEEE